MIDEGKVRAMRTKGGKYKAPTAR
ncbi:MAG: hypothetical protein CISAcid_12850 [uncultured Acidilobus sp. CIS]|nr:MAG: hypothetical protein CISAcid_12850 [uncultured Acidilobus sp. CIS]